MASASPSGYTPELRRRHAFSVLLVVATLALISWGGFVTSINAGLAVPDWPTSFNSLDPFNPWPDWWTITPVLAEHGHRLLGASVGLLTLVLAGWTLLKDRRAWLRRLAVGALILVSLQGVLGGLRVVWISLNLAMVHAGVAQIFFSTTMVLALVTSRFWSEGTDIPEDFGITRRLKVTGLVASLAMYGQIILGALLRHPGSGINPLLAALHIAGAFIATGAILASFFMVRWFFAENRPLRRAATAMFAALVLQVTLGLLAYFVTLNEAGILQPSNLQVVVNTTHLVVGTLLMASTVALTLLAFRKESTPATIPAARRRATPAIA